MYYPLLKKILFQMDPERAHRVGLDSLQVAYRLGLTNIFFHQENNPRQIMGLDFQNPIGLAAGLDKNADYVDALGSLGFGFIEIGTVTPKPQDGNPRPRLFRLIKEEALINRMGFNSKGMEYVANRLEKIRYRGILGINIGKNRSTPNEYAVEDYLLCFKKLCKFASYITINISSPNTPGLRELQQSEALVKLLRQLKQEQKNLQTQQHKYVPIVVKIAPDLSNDELQVMADIFLQEQIDGVIATNTTIHREGVGNSLDSNEMGGLSGRPLHKLNLGIIQDLHRALKNKIPIIASGGVMDKQTAQEKLQAGAKLLQVYTGFIYRGPELIQELNSLFSPTAIAY